MDSSIYRNISVILFAIIFVFVCLFAFRRCADNNQTTDILNYHLNQSKRESDSIIRSKQKRISQLLRDVRLLSYEVTNARAKVDSLERMKTQVQYVYINKLKEINEYDAEQLQEYWQDEFNK